MKIKLDNLTINYIPDDFTSSSKTTVLFIHGFTGSSEDWRFLFDKLDDHFSPVAIDLPGHGRSSSPEKADLYTEESIVDLINNFLAGLNINSVILCGYSMGGRAALSFASKYPDRLKGLILESTTAGIKTQNERLQRAEDDSKLADYILAEGIDKFINDWYNKPLFNSINKSKESLDKLIKGKKNLSPTGLANSLKGFSTGLMKNHWDILEDINMPVLLITGEEDAKFSNINDGMAELLPDARHHTVRSAGHNVHLENEAEFVILLNSFLRKL